MARPTKEELKEREEAKKFIEDNFGGLLTSIKEKDMPQFVDKINEITTKSTGDVVEDELKPKQKKWYDDQLGKQNLQITELKNLLEQKEVIINNLKQGGVQQKPNMDKVNTEVINGVKAIYDDLVYNSKQYRDANINVLIQKFKQKIPVLR